MIADMEIIAPPLILRPLDERDLDRLERLCNDDYIAWNTARIRRPYERADAEAFVAYAVKAKASGEEFPFAVCRNGLMIACAGVAPTSTGHYELGYWVGRDDRGKGVATLAARAATQYAFEVLAAEAVEAGHFKDNPASGRVLARIGMTPTGEIVQTHSLGRGCDVETIRTRIERADFRPDASIFYKGGP